MNSPFASASPNANLWQGYELDPFVRYAEKLVRHNLRIKPRKVMDYWLLWLTEGAVDIRYEGTACTLKPGDLMLVQPDAGHAIEALTPVIKGWSVHFDLFFHPQRDAINPIMPDQLDPAYLSLIQPKLNALDGVSLPLILAPADAPRFLAAFTEAVEQWEIKSAVSQLRANMRLTEMAAMLLEQYVFAAALPNAGREDDLNRCWST